MFNGIHVRRESNPRPGRTVRVTHVVFDLHGGGMESLVGAMAERFAGTAVTMSVIVLSGRVGRVGADVRRHVDTYHVMRPIRGVSMILPIGLARQIRRTRPDIVHLHSGVWYKGSLAARLAGVKRIVYTEHGREHDDPPVRRWLDRRAARRTEVIVTVSDRLHQYLTTVVGVEPSTVCTVWNGVDIDKFGPGPAPSSLRALLEIPDDALVIGSVGRLEHVKGYDRLLQAVSLLLRRGEIQRPVALVICGEGSRRAALAAQAQTLGLDGVARFPGWTESPSDYYRLFDIFALTSRSEGASVSLLEAMACGTAPVVMAAGANSDIVGSDGAHWVIPQGDLDGFANAVRSLLESPAQRQAAGPLARRCVVEFFGLDRMMDQYEQVYMGHAEG